MLDNYHEQKKTARQKIEVLLKGSKMADTELIACKDIISHNCARDFTGVCYNFSAQVARLHGGANMEAQRYKLQISKVSRIGGGRGGGRGRGIWMRGVCDSARRGGQYRRGERRGRQGQTIINGVDVSDLKCYFTAGECTA